MQQPVPDHGTLILFGGLDVFALAALLILYAYHKGQLDENHNGIPVSQLTPRRPPGWDKFLDDEDEDEDEEANLQAGA